VLYKRQTAKINNITMNIMH